MRLRVGGPEYGGTFAARAEGELHGPDRSLRFVLPDEQVEDEPFWVLQASPSRTTPVCRHFGVCGGCDYQHAEGPAQTEIKRGILRETLVRAKLDDLPEILAHSAERWEYRNRIRLRLEWVEGAYRFGYNRRGTREFLPIAECPIAAATLLRSASALLAAAEASSAAAPWLASIAEVEFQTNGEGVQMTVFTRDGRTADFSRLCDAVKVHLPELAGAGCLAATAGYGAKERVAWGAGGLAFRVLERNFWVSRGGFFQVNASMLPTMIGLVTAGRRGRLAWDLYAGVGLFSRVVMESFGEVIAVEPAAAAFADLAQAAKSSKGGRLRALRETAAEFLRRAVVQRERPDLVIVDPPRAGLGAEVCHLLQRVAAREMVYVSCDPTTLASDLALLVHSGYRIEQVHLLEMFPQTFHLETIVSLKK